MVNTNTLFCIAMTCSCAFPNYVSNRIFGFDGWSCETIETTCVNSEPDAVTYTAKVRITIGNIIREGTGAGHGNTKQGIGINHESAIKEAETDAKKRALMSFGNQFGLSLYDKGKAWSKTEETTTSSNKPIDRSDSDKFIQECEAFINKPSNKDKLGLLKKNISKRYETKTISEDQRDGLLTLILEKDDA
jgi:recombination DNA repair RAD52 pathway protein